MKTIKDGEERKKEILMIARKLFVEKGYDQTSINDILKIIEIAKGTFYYYFTSKEELLEEIIMQIVVEGADRAKLILQDDTVPILQRIVMAVLAQAPEFEGAHRLAEELHKVENAKLEQQYRKVMLKKMTEVLEDTIIEARAEGKIHTDYPRECIESILLLGHMMFDCDTFLWKEEEYPRKIKAFLCNIERLLDTENGAFQQFEEVFRR